jgi:hypothetical protein
MLRASRAIEATIGVCPSMMSVKGPECGGNVKLSLHASKIALSPKKLESLRFQ